MHAPVRSRPTRAPARMFRFFLAVLLPVLAGPGAFARPLDVLFVGNSYVYVNNLPEVFRQVAAGAAQEAPRVVSHASGGQTLAGHGQDAALLKKLEAPYDVVILQEQSQLPALAETDRTARQQFLEACTGLAGYIHQRQPATRIILFQTWARHRQAWLQAPGAGALGANPEEMQARLHRWYAEAARQCGAEVAPVGDLWRDNYRRAQPLMLHASDGSHPAMAGTYLAALVLVSVVYAIPPTTHDDGSLPPETARQLRALVQAHPGLGAAK